MRNRTKKCPHERGYLGADQWARTGGKSAARGGGAPNHLLAAGVPDPSARAICRTAAATARRFTPSNPPSGEPPSAEGTPPPARERLDDQPAEVTIDRLERLNHLRREGALTEAEFEEQKKKLLRACTPPMLGTVAEFIPP